MALPLDTLRIGDSISLFQGPQVGANYVGTREAICTVVLEGTATVTVQYNVTPMVVNTTAIPNPNKWVSVRDVLSAGTIEIPLMPRAGINWIRVILRTAGTGTATISATWQTFGSSIDPYLFLGYWDADANDPELISDIGPNGGYYIVQVPGTTTLNDISVWALGDIVAFNRTAWIKKLPGVIVQNP